jgi:2-(1,2-epoxy-1,2-dihydrophenyl)acetyl-CoA isomerase
MTSMGSDKTPDGTAISTTVSGAVATIVMHTAALTTVAKSQLLDAVGAAAGDDAVRAVVLTGTGRVFCAGQDLGEHAAALDADLATAFTTLDEHYGPIVTALHEAPKPVIAAINGACAGAGMSLALACDLRVCSETAKFTTAFTGIGLSFDSALSATLARAVGAARASELILLAEPFTAQQALEWGIVGRLVPADQVATAAGEVAARLAAGPTMAFAAAKRAIAASWAAPWREVLAHENEAQRRLGASQDHVGAVASFLAKERPTFAGQ